MSWSAPKCHHCSSSPTRFQATVTYGPSFAFGIDWVCQACHGRTLELCPIGPNAATPGSCLNCGAPRVGDHCSECKAEHQQIVARVAEHCELPPRTDKIRGLRSLGLYRVAFNAVLLRLLANPDDVEALATKAKLLIDVHRPVQAVSVLREVLSRHARAQTHTEAEVDLGVALAESGQHREAILVYQSFLITHPIHPARGVVLSNLGGCLSALGRTREAEGYHREAIKIDPEHLGPRWNLFANLNGQGRHAEALGVIDRTLELPWLEPAARENMQAFRSELLLELGRPHEALAAINASLVSDPNEPDRLFARGRILHRLGRHEQARVVLLQVLEICPGSQTVQRLLARVNEARGAAPN